MKNKITIFADGSCLGNPGPGGYCTIIEYKKYRKKFSSGFFLTTNNRMELMSVIIGIEKIKISSNIKIQTDSKYVYYGITKWMKNWKKNNWNTKNKKKIKNVDLWIRLNKIIKKHKHIKWIWIKSHSGNFENELCDEYAKKAAQKPTKTDKTYIKEKGKLL
ncbi:ribonuclease HI [Buchnera aphidicola]|uniref:ribonuclease HI n=1 Tax=Buchnera aphidicola TaxID=9 RepID=UPI003463A743